MRRAAAEHSKVPLTAGEDGEEEEEGEAHGEYVPWTYEMLCAAAANNDQNKARRRGTPSVAKQRVQVATQLPEASGRCGWPVSGARVSIVRNSLSSFFLSTRHRGQNR